MFARFAEAVERERGRYLSPRTRLAQRFMSATGLPVVVEGALEEPPTDIMKRLSTGSLSSPLESMTVEEL